MESKKVKKTKLLSETEAKALRLQVQQRYLQGGSARQPVSCNTFLGAYEDLRLDIIRMIPESEASVSLTRLRKLFYYSDPSLCEPGQLERPSFGKDFLDVLERYGGKQEAQTPYFWSPTGWISGLLLMTALTGFGFWLLYHPADKTWKEDFKDISMPGLKQRGWSILDPDSVWMGRQLRPDSMLTLWTLPGDNWVKANEERKITNFLYHACNSECFAVTMKVCQFSPYQASQQVDLVLSDGKLDHLNWVRLGFECVQNPATREKFLQICCTRSLDGEIRNIIPGYIGPLTDTLRNKTQEVWLRLEASNGAVVPSLRVQYAWDPITGFTEPIRLGFIPKYIGVGAFQGWTFNDGTPKNAQIIPAFIEYILYEPCSAKE